MPVTMQYHGDPQGAWMSEAGGRSEHVVSPGGAPAVATRASAALVETRAEPVRVHGSLGETRAVLGETRGAPAVRGSLGETHALDAAATTAGTRPLEAALVEVNRGTLLGRYVVLDQLGAGAMGVVYAAFDPELGRKVAIKLLLPDGSTGTAAQDGRARLVREAQALAQLSHPNVVTIYDVGTHGEAVWIAMELIEGRTLRAWLAERPRAWLEVLAVMRAAGLGLAAAHAAGLVHRDVKPDNVMVAVDGRVRMMDFGLARGEAAVDQPGEFGRALLGVEVTRIGSLIGTPAYMASEQLRGEHAGAPADVFAFCVMLWEGLHGARPFAGATLEQLRDNVAQGKIVAPPPGRRVPAWISEALLRGLAADPRRRWPGMTALLAALETGQTRARRRRLLAVAAGGLSLVALAVAGSAASRRAEHAARVAACEALGDRIAEVWDDPARARLRAGLRSDDPAAPDDTAERTTPWLDAWADQWRRVRFETCSAHAVEAAWSADLRARADECLDEKLDGFTALLAVLSAGDTRYQAVVAAAELPSASACADAEELARRPALPAADLAALRELRSQLARVVALERTGKYKEGLPVAQATLTTARTLGWAPALAEAQLRLGAIEWRSGDYASGARDLEEAYFAASLASAETVAVDAATALVIVAGDRLSRPEEGLRWARLAELALVRLGSGGQTLRDADLLNNRGLLRRSTADFAGAVADLTAARSRMVTLLGADHPFASQVAANLAIVHAQLGDLAQEQAALDAALAAALRTFGPQHPSVAIQYNNLGTSRGNRGDLAGALDSYTRALAIYEHTLGPEHTDVADTVRNIAVVRFKLGEVEAAEASMRRVLEIHERILGQGDATVADTLRNLAFVQDARGKYDEAKATIERSIEIRRRVHGDEHLEMAALLGILGLVQRHRGEYDASRAAFTRALAIQEKALPADHLEIAGAHRGLAHAAALRGDVTAARAHLERAGQLPASALAEARVATARAWWDASPGERAEARALAELARDGFPEGSPPRADVDAWLALHR